ncbi:MAG: ECF transporter S component, partial [Clostridiales bacterium]|nr:ECF transporter S component [Clostridiales bacterium]
RLLFVKTKKKKFLLIAIIGEIIMVGGYFLSETLFLPLIFEEAGFAVAVTGVPFNSIQGVVNIIVAVLCIKLLQKLKVKELREF